MSSVRVKSNLICDTTIEIKKCKIMFIRYVKFSDYCFPIACFIIENICALSSHVWFIRSWVLLSPRRLSGVTAAAAAAEQTALRAHQRKSFSFLFSPTLFPYFSSSSLFFSLFAFLAPLLLLSPLFVPRGIGQIPNGEKERDRKRVIFLASIRSFSSYTRIRDLTKHNFVRTL